MYSFRSSALRSLPVVALLWFVVLLPYAVVAQTETVALFRQEFILEGDTPEVLTEEQVLEFEQVMGSYLTGTTCDVLAQETIGEAESSEFILQVDYECLFAGSPVLVTSYYDFVRQQLDIVSEDLSVIGVVESLAPVLVEVNGDAPSDAAVTLPTNTTSTANTTSTTSEEDPLDDAEPTTAPAATDATSNNVTQFTAGLRQGFVVADDTTALTGEQEMLLAMQMDVYTELALQPDDAQEAPTALQVTTQCVVNAQTFARAETGENLLLVESECTWTSRNPLVNVQEIPRVYVTYINDNLDTMADDLRVVGLTMLQQAWPIQLYTGVTSQAPSSAPSATRDSKTVTGSFAQRLFLWDMPESSWTDAQLADVSAIFASYTSNFVDEDAGTVETICEINDQDVVAGETDGAFMNLRYECMYTSVQAIVDDLPELFIDNVNANLVQVTEDLADFGVAEALAVRDSTAPTMAPTDFPAAQFASGSYTQEFIMEVVGGASDIALGNLRETEFDTVIARYTREFGADDRSVDTACQVDGQWERIDDLEQTFLKVDYSCNYTAVEAGVNVTGYPNLFVDYVNDNLVQVTEDLQDIDDTIFEALPVKERETRDESENSDPTDAPDAAPTVAPVTSSVASNDTNAPLETDAPIDTNSSTAVPLDETEVPAPEDEVTDDSPPGNATTLGTNLTEAPTISPVPLANGSLSRGGSDAEASSGRMKDGIFSIALGTLLWVLI